MHSRCASMSFVQFSWPFSTMLQRKNKYFSSEFTTIMSGLTNGERTWEYMYDTSLLVTGKFQNWDHRSWSHISHSASPGKFLSIKLNIDKLHFRKHKELQKKDCTSRWISFTPPWGRLIFKTGDLSSFICPMSSPLSPYMWYVKQHWGHHWSNDHPQWSFK